MTALPTAVFHWSTPIPRDGYPRPSHPAPDLYRVADVRSLRAWLDAHGFLGLARGSAWNVTLRCESEASVTRGCVWCGGPFHLGKRSHARTCSKRCRQGLARWMAQGREHEDYAARVREVSRSSRPRQVGLF